MTSRPTGCVFIATSLDGFIAREDGTIDWLLALHARAPAGEDFGYAAFVRDIDVLVMGRHSYETALGFDAWPYGATPVHVLSSRPLAARPAGVTTLTSSAEAPAALVERLGAAGARRLYLDGGETIRRFLAAGLVDELTVTQVPVLLGRGRPLFGGPLPHDVVLEHLGTTAWDCGFVQSRYRRPAAAQEGS